MNRRSFLSSLGLGAAALALDPERLLWVPGAKTIFIPKPPVVEPMAYTTDLFTGTIGFVGHIPIPLSAVDTTKMGPFSIDGYNNIYRIVELLPGKHIHWYGETIYAVPGGKIQVLVRGRLPVGLSR